MPRNTRENMGNKALVIGSGIAGLSAAIRLQCKGYQVTILEKNHQYGGKISQIKSKGYSFDTGPSLFTLPELIDELYELTGQKNQFKYLKLDKVCTYFFDNGQQFVANSDPKKFSIEFSQAFNEPLPKVKKFIKRIKRNYDLTTPVFLESSLHTPKTYLRRSGLYGILNLWRLNMFQTMNKNISLYFNNPNAIQYFNRFATYNGSNPYQAPATLCVIPNIEINKGAYFPKYGMVNIAESLYNLAKSIGVTFKFDTEVQKICYKQKKVTGVETKNGIFIPSEVIVSNVDAKLTYKMLDKKVPSKISNAENSSSAVIFYWGINHSFKELGLHNILFSKNYQEEFNQIFNKKTLPDDPTVYINISSKLKASDAPEGCENWFVMINTPADYGQNWDDLVAQAKEKIIQRINQALGTDIRSKIQTEHILTPPLIASKTGSDKGSLYGSSSNTKMSAFLRQSNFSSEAKGLYFCGGSVHPGGGIPLCLHSAKIVSDFIPSIK